MSAILNLKQTEIPLPDMTLITTIYTRLSGNGLFPMVFYGGWLSDLVLIGHTEGTGDIDTAMTIENFLALKTPAKTDDVRFQFALHDPHLLFMLHQTHDKVFEANPKPYVLALKPEHQAEWGLDHSLGVTLTRQAMTASDFANDVDLGFRGIASDGKDIWVTEAFLKDYRNKTITLQRVRDSRDFERTRRRVEKFQQSRYRGWKFIVPEKFTSTIDNFFT